MAIDNRATHTMKSLPIGCLPLAEAGYLSKSEKELAECQKRRGAWIVSKRGHFWKHIGGFCWQPIHWLARLEPADIGKPHPLCLAFVATLNEKNEGVLTGTMPLYAISGEKLKRYSIGALKNAKVRNLRKAEHLVQTVAMVDPRPHIERLYAITTNAVERFRGKIRTSIGRFEDGIRARVIEEKDLLLVGLVNGEIAGYILTSCVEDVVYVDQVMLHSDYLSTNIGVKLTFDTIRTAQKSERIKHVIHGRHSIELPNLSRFKTEMGFEVVQWPAVHWIAKTLRWYLKWRAPEKLYRLTGHVPQE